MCCESGAWIVYRESGAKKRVFCGENLPVCGERAVDMGFFSNMYTKEGPGVRKDQGCAPGGVTIRGVAALEENALF